jgi:hypothetical protein
MRGTWQTTDGGGGGEIVLALLAVLAVAAIAGPVVAAVGGVVHILFVTAAVLVGVAAAALVGFIAWRPYRWRHPSAARAAALPPGAAPAAKPLPEPQRAALERAPEVHVHHHWHGVSAEDVAAILRPRTGPLR